MDTNSSPSFAELLEARLSRRAVLGGAAALAGAAAAGLRPTRALAQSTSAATPAALSPMDVGFTPIPSFAITDDAVRVPAGYLVDVVIAWGDPVVPGAPAFDLNNQSAARQAQQCGFNHDFQAFFPLGAAGNEGVFFVSHEYTTPNQMIPGYQANAAHPRFKEWVDIELEAHGGTIVELERPNATSAWKVRMGKRNRRITANTQMTFSGPAAGDPRIGTSVVGMLNNCAGGCDAVGNGPERRGELQPVLRERRPHHRCEDA